MYHISTNTDQPIVLDVEIHGIPVRMELDTGSGKSIISDKLYKERFHNLPLQNSTLTFVTYTKEEVKPLDNIDAEVKYGDQILTLPLYVITNDSPPLFGREWLQHVQLNWPQIHAIRAPPPIDQLFDKHKPLFDEQLGTLKGIQAKLT